MGIFRAQKAQSPREAKSCGISYHLKRTTYNNVIGKRLCVSESSWTGLSIGAKKLSKSYGNHGDITSQKTSHFRSRTLYVTSTNMIQ